MNKVFIMAIIRHVIGWIGALLVAKGYFTPDLWDGIQSNMVELVTGFILSGASVGASLIDKTAKQPVIISEPVLPVEKYQVEPERPSEYIPDWIDVPLLVAMGVQRVLADKYCLYLSIAAKRYQINTPLRVVHWLAQIMQESGCLQWTHELWDGKGAQADYDTRTDLGNTPEKDGDGKHNRGVGFIQATGEYNIEKTLAALGYPPDSNENLATPEGASLSAGYFWKTHGLNEIADRSGSDVTACTRVVNGGYSHLKDRQKFFDKGMSYMASVYLKG